MEYTVRFSVTTQLMTAMIAARQFLPPSHCGLIVDRGDDFPPEFSSELEGFGKEMVYFRQRDGKTSRALNTYSGKRIGCVLVVAWLKKERDIKSSPISRRN